MRSDRALRACMQALVLLDLVFVQLTGAAGLHWLGPLFALTVAAPFLERYRERLVYRLLWNAGVVGFFLLLLRHALRADLAYVLEDGLVLAALCQVHLLNNLRSNQRPDLLFFNAFLIAIITGYMNRGLGFPLAFLAFAPCFVVGLQLLSATRGGHVLSRTDTRRLVVDGGRRAAVVLASSLLVFLFWPRDFERKALFNGKFDMPTGGASKREVGFNEKLELDGKGSVGASSRETLRVKLLEGESSDVPPLWRGATLGSTDGSGWRPMEPSVQHEAGQLDEPWHGRRGSLARPGSTGAKAARVEVVRFENGTERLFAPLAARALQLAAEHADGLLRARPDGTLDTAVRGDVRYVLTLACAPDVKPGARWADGLPARLVPYVELPETWRIERARELAARVAQQLPADAGQQEVVARVSDYLARTYTYLPPGTEGAASTLDEFLSGVAGGHCEFFASALATMLRSLAVPSRVVTGYRGTRWDEEGRVLAIQARDAHAWVEAYDPQAGWYAVDPSPVLVAADLGESLWARLRSGARSVWDNVTDFDSERRAALFAWARAVPGRFASLLHERPLEAGLSGMLLALSATWFVRRRRARTEPAVRAYRTAVRRARLRLLPGETPRELLTRARTEDLSRAQIQSLAEATRRHEAARYAA